MGFDWEHQHPGIGSGREVGDYFWSRRESIPKCLKCEGQELSRTTYSALFALQGTEQGVGDGSTTFSIYDSTRPSSMPRPNPVAVTALACRLEI